MAHVVNVEHPPIGGKHSLRHEAAGDLPEQVRELGAGYVAEPSHDLLPGPAVDVDIRDCALRLQDEGGVSALGVEMKTYMNSWSRFSPSRRWTSPPSGAFCCFPSNGGASGVPAMPSRPFSLLSRPIATQTVCCG